MLNSRVHDDLRRFRVLPDVELCQGRRVADTEARASHAHDPSGLLDGFLIQANRQGKVGQGSQGDDVDLPRLACFQRFQHPNDAVALADFQPVRNQTDISHSVLAMGLRGILHVPQQHNP